MGFTLAMVASKPHNTCRNNGDTYGDRSPHPDHANDRGVTAISKSGTVTGCSVSSSSLVPLMRMLGLEAAVRGW